MTKFVVIIYFTSEYRFSDFVSQHCLGVTALFSGVSKMSGWVRPVFWCVQNVRVSSSCFLVCHECVRVSVLFPAVSWYRGVPPCLLLCQECCDVFTLLPGVSRRSRDVRLCFLVCPGFGSVRLVCWYDQNVAVFSPSLLVSGILWCVGLVFGCVQNVSVSLPCFLVCR